MPDLHRRQTPADRSQRRASIRRRGYAIAALAAVLCANSFIMAGAAGRTDRARDLINSSGSSAERAEAAAKAAEIAVRVNWGEAAEHEAAALMLTEDPDLEAAADASWRALKSSPARSTTWARLAYIDAVANNGLTDTGRRALSLSYATGPLGAPNFLEWRLRFAAEAWPWLDDELKQATLLQARASPWVARRLARHEVNNEDGAAALRDASDAAIAEELRDGPRLAPGAS